MNTCRTCRWWGPNAVGERDPNDDSENVHVCACPKVHFGKCDYGDDFDGPVKCVDAETGSAIASDEAAIQDGSGYYAAFFPGPDFGCIHHELREGEFICGSVTPGQKVAGS